MDFLLCKTFFNFTNLTLYIDVLLGKLAILVIKNPSHDNMSILLVTHMLKLLTFFVNHHQCKHLACP